ncbi:tyrosine-type recombinase/integrase [[Ruminococcus] torques]|uniref:tyrosine-type recombinase/integrase n=1 Tax=[Ruminococcus] torques TaxID=33039 RepID=UPI0006C005C3|nr:tyrosine-type recombinase/integrase [[Ruminococcus] torques]CUQ71806.1 Integrase [[Ruminococcus] torques]
MDEHSYDDIINLPNPTSKNHPRMSLHDRAAQFAPFAALTGHDAAIKETARLTDERLELIRRIIRDCNDEQFLHSDEPDVLLPHFSCHSLRHTFTTRMCEAGVNIKVIQDALGHSDISTTLNIYADVTKEMKAAEFKGLDSYFIV